MAADRHQTDRQVQILVVDRDPLSIGGLIAVLPLSIETVVASSVADALRVGDRGEFDLVVVGVPMDDDDGLSVLDDVRVAFPASPILALSSDPDTAFLTEVVGRGASEALGRQGLSSQDFAAAVERVLEASNPRDEIAGRVAHVEGVLSAVGEGILVQSASGRIVLANDRAVEMLQVPREVLVSSDLHTAGIEVRSAAGRVLSADELPDAVARRSRGPAPPVLLQVRRGDGELRWFEATTSPLVRAGEEEPYAVVTSFRDVTEAQVAQEAMVGAERRERLLLENAGEGYLVIDERGVVREASELVERFWPRESIVSRELRELVTEDDRAEFSTLVDDVVANRASPLRTEVRVLDSRGSIRWTEFTLANRLDEPSLFGVVVNLRDVTDRKRAEEVAVRLSAVLESSDEAIFSETLDGVITSWNGAAERLYGYSAREAIGTSSLIITPAERLNAVLDVRERILNRKRVELERSVRRRKDGSDVEVTLIVSPLFDTSGNLIGSSTTSRPVSSFRPPEQRLASSDDRLRLSFEQGAIGMAIIDRGGRFSLVNPALCRMLGRDEDELVGSRPAEFLHSGDIEARQAEGLGVNDPARYEGERHFLRPDGSIVNALVGVTAIRGEDGSTYYFCQMQDITLWKKSEADLEHHALHDPLTGLPNRGMLSARLELAILRNRQDQTRSAIVELDIDRFQVVNDGLGQEAGDALLIDASHRLTSAFGPPDMVARFGGDEFVVLFESVVDAAAAEVVGGRVKALFDEPFVVGGSPVFVTVSCGVALIDGSATLDDALRAADAAMHRAKDRGRDQVEVFDDRIGEEVARRFDLEREIRFALDRNELVVLYQPILKVASAELVGVEALVRWEHPDRGTLTPDEFIPVAEQSGLIAQIGSYVLETALRQVMAWRSEVPGCEELWVSVNLSSRQLVITNPVTMCLWALAATGAPANALRLELTETAVMREVDTSISRLEDLRSIGIKVAIDDFGTGHSSLTYLNRLPVGSLKVDHSFVSAIGSAGSQAIVDSIVGLARTLHLELYAEGIESQDQRIALFRLGCEYGQGYLWSKPLSAAEFERWVGATFPSPRRPEDDGQSSVTTSTSSSP